MKLVCPSCGFYGPPDAYMSDVPASRALLLAMSMPAALAQPMQQYLRLFRPAQRAMSSSRVATLLEELLPMVLEAKISWRGVVYPAPLEYWRDGIEDMLQSKTLTLPVKNHHYLLAILAGYAQKADAAGEAKSHQTRAGVTPIGVSAAHKAFDPEHQPAPVASKQDHTEGRAALRAALTRLPQPKE